MGDYAAPRGNEHLFVSPAARRYPIVREGGV